MSSLLLAFSPAELIPIIPLFIPIVVVVFGGLTAIFALYFHNQRQAMWHETARVALEKGQPIPPMPASGDARQSSLQVTPAEWEETKLKQRYHGYLIGGLVNLAVGIGLFVFLSQFAGKVGYVGAIPGCVGVALLIGAAIVGKSDSKPVQ